MGQRISYFKNDFGKGLKDLIMDHFIEFRAWYLGYDQSSMEEFNEPFGSEALKAFLRKEPDFVSGFDKLDKQIVDELTAEFIGHYCDLTDRDGTILNFFGPAMSVWRYDESSNMVSATNDQAFLNLWNFMIKGRSLSDHLNFNSYANDYKIGFLYRQEVEQLESKIRYYFGDLEVIKEKYWTASEKRQLEQAIANSKDGTYSLVGHNPKSSGLEYVLIAISELNEHNKELITGIE